MLSFSTILLRLCVALLLGGLIGIERESREHNAGLRTLALVALGTTLFTIISAVGFSDMLGTAHVQVDPTRIASYVIAGIGFLGGGVIFHHPTTQKVRGLTSAATVWVVASVGMACGAGLLLEACVVTALALLILVGFRYLEGIFWPQNPLHLQHLHIKGTQDTQGELLGHVYDLCTQAGLLVEEVKIHAEGTDHTLEIIFRSADPQILLRTINEIQSLSGVRATSVNLQNRAMSPF